MIHPELKLYYDQIFQFCKSIIFKSELMAFQMKNTTLKVSGIEIESDYQNPYYINLTGEYSFLDEPIYIIENGEKIVLDQNLLTNKPWLRKKYNIYGTAFEKLVSEYPNRESLIRCIICQPYKTLKAAIEAEDLSIAYYDDSILDYQERFSLLETLNDYVVMYKKRWAINEFAYEELYALSSMAVFISQIPVYLLSKRVKNIKTQFAHTMHIWDYLTSYGLDDYRSVLTVDQQLFLYKNIDYIVKNIGKHGTLAILIEKLLNQSYLTIAPKMVINDYSYDLDDKLKISPSIVSRQFDQTPISQFFDADSINTEQFLYILFINGFISKWEYEKYLETEEKLALIGTTTLQTKYLELKRNFPSNPTQNFLLNMLVSGLFHFVYKNKLNYNIPIYLEEFDYTELLNPRVAILLMIYCLQRETGVQYPKVPFGIKIYPFVCNYEIEDKIIPGTDKKISDYVEITSFMKRYSELLDDHVFNFNNEPIENIIKSAGLILEDLLLSMDNDVNLNLAISEIHKQMFTYKEEFIENNEVPLFDMPGMLIKDWFQLNHSSLYEVLNKIEVEESANYESIVNQIMDEFFPSSIINDSDLNVFIPDSYKYDKLKQLFIQLCSYNVVFIDTNVKNQITTAHDPLLTNYSPLLKLGGLTDLLVESYSPLRYEELENDPLLTGELVMKVKLNDIYDKLIQCKLEMCDNPYFTSNVISIESETDFFTKKIGIKPNELIPGTNYFVRVAYRSLIFDFEYIGPSENFSFNCGRIRQPRLNLPKIVDPTTLAKVRSPHLYIDDPYVEGKVVSDEFTMDLTDLNYVLKKDSVKTPIITIDDESITGQLSSTSFQIEDSLDEDGKVIQLTSTPMTLSFSHEDKHIESRWIIARDEKLTDIVKDTDWISSLNSVIFSIKTNDLNQYYFGVQYKGKRFGISKYSNITSFASSEIKQPSIEDVFGVYEPANKSIFKIQGDNFEVLGTGTDTHIASRWVIAGDKDMRKIVFDSGWLTTNLTFFNTNYFTISEIEVVDIEVPQLTILDKHLDFDNISSSEFDYSSFIDYVKPEKLYIFVQYKGQTLGESLFSEPWEVTSTTALRGDLKVNITESEDDI